MTTSSRFFQTRSVKITEHIFTGWWLGHPSEKYEFVNWDDEIPNISGKIKNGNQSTNQFRYVQFIFSFFDGLFGPLMALGSSSGTALSPAAAMAVGEICIKLYQSLYYTLTKV